MKSFRENIKIPIGAVWLFNSISEYKGKQELYMKQSLQILKTLREIALIESAESSNRIEGVVVEKERLRPIILGKSRPRDRSEEEVVGYRNALNLIHGKFKELEISPKIISHLHYLCLEGAYDAGKWKEKDNEIIKRNPDGSVEVIFKPLSAKETPKAIDDLCLLYKQSYEQWKYPPLYAIACLILDFLCIHPFRDGNGRVSRLLTLLALYQYGYNVGRYISLERIVEDSKETYYEVLNKSSLGWHQAKHDLEPWLYYFLGTINSAYREFEKRAMSIKLKRGTKTEIILNAIDSQIGEFSFSDIVRSCPGISKDMVKLVFKRLEREKKIVCLRKGRNAIWRKLEK